MKNCQRLPFTFRSLALWKLFLTALGWQSGSIESAPRWTTGPQSDNRKKKIRATQFAYSTQKMGHCVSFFYEYSFINLNEHVLILKLAQSCTFRAPIVPLCLRLRICLWVNRLTHQSQVEPLSRSSSTISFRARIHTSGARICAAHSTSVVRSLSNDAQKPHSTTTSFDSFHSFLRVGQRPDNLIFVDCRVCSCLLWKTCADTAENEQTFANILTKYWDTISVGSRSEGSVLPLPRHRETVSGAGRQNFGGLVLGCIDADFCTYLSTR